MAPSDAIEIVPLYVPAASPVVLNPTVNAAGALVVFNDGASQLPPAGVFTVTDVARLSVPVPAFVMLMTCDAGFEPPTPPLAVILDSDVEIVGGGTMNSTGTVTLLIADAELIVMLP